MPKLLNRLQRASRIGYTALCVWLRYKAPQWWDRLRGNDPDARDMRGIHQRHAQHTFENMDPNCPFVHGGTRYCEFAKHGCPRVNDGPGTTTC